VANAGHEHVVDASVWRKIDGWLAIQLDRRAPDADGP
jgi:hypothetical protein